jgi:hypothetical protein
MNWGSYVYTLAVEGTIICPCSPALLDRCQTYYLTVTMILRTFAMYNQSRRLRYFLVVLFIPVVVVEFVLSVLYFGPSNGMHGTSYPPMSCRATPLIALTVRKVALVGTEICTSNFSLSPLLYIYFSLPGIVFDGILAIFAIARAIPFMQRSLGGCRINVCMRVLARDSVFYFLGFVHLQILTRLGSLTPYACVIFRNFAYRSFNLIPLTNLPVRVFGIALCAWPTSLTCHT